MPLPAEACGLAVDTLVVDDGSTDGTSAVARGDGAHVARLERNCGHGVALRLGYELAREHGARFIVTLDGDGQWDPVELPGVLEPVVRGEADFVIGSRVLGRPESEDALRQAGVHVFAALVRLLTGARVTDTSSRLPRDAGRGHRRRSRSVRSQYQTSELLIGAIAPGYRSPSGPSSCKARRRARARRATTCLRAALRPA